MSRRIENADVLLLRAGRNYLIQNADGKKGKLSLRTLTAECGIALGTFYHYFRSKDDLVRHIMENDWRQIISRLDVLAMEDLPLREKIEALYREISLFDRNYRYSAIAMLKPSEENRAARKEGAERMTAKIREILAAEIKNGNLILDADLDNAAYLILQLIIATSMNPKMDFDELWKCMTFRDTSRAPY